MIFTNWPSLLVVDVEGNGSNPPDVVEVAALPIRDGKPDTSTAGVWTVRPPNPVSSFASRVHGLTNEVLSTCPRWEQVADQARGLLGNAWICVHNAHVDYGVLIRHLPDWAPAGVIDTLRLARATYKNLPSHSLDALINHVKPDLTHAPAQRHRATFDAYATALLLIAMADQYDTWDRMTAVAVPPNMPGAPEPEEGQTLW